MGQRGKDYEYVSGYYAQLLEEQLAGAKRKFELEQEEAKKKSEMIMGGINMALSGRQIISNVRSSHIRQQMRDTGAMDKYSRSDDNYGKTWEFEDQNFFGKTAEVVLGWERGFKMIDGDDGRIKPENDNIVSNNDVKDATLLEEGSTYNPNGKQPKYKQNPNGEMDEYYVEDDGSVTWKNYKEDDSTASSEANTIDTTLSNEILSSGGNKEAQIDADAEEIKTSETSTDTNTVSTEGDFSTKEIDRAQSYIDKGWAPDDTVTRGAYESLGGKHKPSGGWGDEKGAKKDDKFSNVNDEDLGDLKSDDAWADVDLTDEDLLSGEGTIDQGGELKIDNNSSFSDLVTESEDDPLLKASNEGFKDFMAPKLTLGEMNSNAAVQDKTYVASSNRAMTKRLEAEEAKRLLEEMRKRQQQQQQNAMAMNNTMSTT